MSTAQAGAGRIIENAELDRPDEQPQIHVEERRLSLHDFLKTSIKINGSDVHLQAGSLPMIRVDGRPRFLDCGPLSDEAMKEYVDQIIHKQAEPDEKREILDKRGSVDVAYALEGLARFRTNIFHSRERYAIVMRRIVTKIPNFTDLALPPQVEGLADHQRGIIIVSGT